MIITRIIGGLGNQMFQYAIGRSLAFALNTNLKLDINEFEKYKLHKYLLEKYKIVEDYATKDEIEAITKRKTKIERILNKLSVVKYKNQIYSEKREFCFDPEVFHLKGDIYLTGYWQTDKYFRNIEEIIRKEFTLKNPPEGKNKEFLSMIEKSNSVALHIRRGDYITNTSTLNKHGICSLDYYNEGIELINSKISKPIFFVFSDDPEWVKENLKIPNNEKHYLTHNKKNEAYEDLRLMKNCKHFITANSTFSWWGAWLSSNINKIVITPKKWLSNNEIQVSNLIPEEWLRI